MHAYQHLSMQPHQLAYEHACLVPGWEQHPADMAFCWHTALQQRQVRVKPDTL